MMNGGKFPEVTALKDMFECLSSNMLTGKQILLF